MTTQDDVRRQAIRRVIALLDAARAVFDDAPCEARDWLHTPHPGLNGTTPAAAAWLSEGMHSRALALLPCAEVYPQRSSAARRRGGCL